MPNVDEPRPAANGHQGNVSRRSFIQTLGISAAAGAVGDRVAQGRPLQDGQAGPTVLGPDPIKISLKVNGQPMQAQIDPATTLMEALRWHFQLTGTKEVCERGSCGACSVLVDGKLIVSCMMLAVDAIGCEITTIEGLATGDELSKVQEAFVRHDALQCGYCTPGLVVASHALLDSNPKPTLNQIKRGLSGNICRCGTYTNVFNAVLEASGQAPVMDAGGVA